MPVSKTFRNNDAGNVAIIFAITAVSLTAIAGGAIDYMKSVSARSSLQAVADSAALATAKELQLSGAQAGGIDNVAKQYIEANKLTYKGKGLKSLDVDVKVSEKKATVDILLSAKVTTNFMSLLGFNKELAISARAQARLVGGLPLCVLALDEIGKHAIQASGEAKMSAMGCSLYSNSANSEGITSWDKAELKTGLTCSAGGAKGGGRNYSPAPLTDCPGIPDPLIDRAAPVVNECLETGLKITHGTHFLTKGTYCGGLTISGDADVIFESGEFVIKDGKFKVTGNAKVTGEDVAFYFQGNDALVEFTGNAEVEFEGIKSGTMAGLLFFGDRSTAYNHVHKISSRKVKKLEGTIYFPQGELVVSDNSSAGGGGSGGVFGDSGDDDDDDLPFPFCMFCSSSDSGVASESAYTVIITKKLSLSGKTALVLNTDYASSEVPLPSSVANLSGRVVLNR